MKTVEDYYNPKRRNPSRKNPSRDKRKNSEKSPQETVEKRASSDQERELDYARKTPKENQLPPGDNFENKVKKNELKPKDFDNKISTESQPIPQNKWRRPLKEDEKRNEKQITTSSESSLKSDSSLQTPPTEDSHHHENGEKDERALSSVSSLSSLEFSDFSISNPEERFPWFKNNYSSDYLVMLHQEIKDFMNYISPTETEHKLRTYILGEIKKTIINLWPCAEVKVYGSFETQLYLPTGDIDIVVFVSWPSDVPPPLHRLASELEKAKLVESIKVIDKARVPIIKMKDSFVGFDIDISFNMISGVKATEIIKDKIQEFPALVPLAFVLKQFLLQRGFNEVFTGGLSSYSVVVLIISSLQMHPILQPRGEPNLGVLLIQFFELYGKNFNYQALGISIRSNGRYYQKLPLPLLSIEDPQDPDNDLALSSFNFQVIRQSFEDAFTILSSRISPSLNRQKPLKESILGKIVEITPQAISMRKKIEEVAQKLNLT